MRTTDELNGRKSGYSEVLYMMSNNTKYTSLKSKIRERIKELNWVLQG